MKSQVRYSALFLLFSVIDNFEWFWMESLHKNIQLMWEFLKAPFLVLHFSYYALMTFLMMLSVMLLSMLMILLSIPSVIRHLTGWPLFFGTQILGTSRYFPGVILIFPGVPFYLKTGLDWCSYFRGESFKLSATPFKVDFFTPCIKSYFWGPDTATSLFQKDQRKW